MSYINYICEHNLTSGLYKMTRKTIKHDGIVSKLSNASVEVSIAISTACAGCHAQASCGMMDDNNRIINITQSAGGLKLGDKVQIEGAQSLGMKAVFYAYVLPFLLVLAVLIISLSLFNITETKAGLYALLILPIYYFVLYLFKSKFEEKYTFRIISQ